MSMKNIKDFVQNIRGDQIWILICKSRNKSQSLNLIKYGKDPQILLYLKFEY